MPSRGALHHSAEEEEEEAETVAAVYGGFSGGDRCSLQSLAEDRRRRRDWRWSSSGYGLCGAEMVAAVEA